MFVKTLMTGLAVSIMTTLATPSFAGTCKDVNLTAKNFTGHQIVIVGLAYQTFSEAGYKIGGQRQNVSNVAVPADGEFFVQRNLKGAKNTQTRLFVEYRVKRNFDGWNKWSEIKRQKSWAFDCFSGSNIELMLVKL